MHRRWFFDTKACYITVHTQVELIEYSFFGKSFLLLFRPEYQNHFMKILFLSRSNSCRSQIAEAILRKMDKNLEIYSAGLDPVTHVEPIACEVMAEIGIKIEQKKPENFNKYADIEFDFLITVGDGTPEELRLPPVKARRKMHLGFQNPFKTSRNPEVIKECCREIRDEIQAELDYFYNKILKKELEKQPH
jgi:arsenate reductase (thioredoxin)